MNTLVTNQRKKLYSRYRYIEGPGPHITMKYHTRAFNTAALALYVIHVVSGQAIHQLQHLVSDSLCCENNVVATCSADAGNHNHGSHGGSSVATLDSSTMPYAWLRMSLPAGHDQNRDTSECWTCHVLNQVSQVSVKVEMVVSDAATHPVTIPTSGVSLASILGPVKSRGPPAFLS